MYKKIINLIYPNICGICGEKINERYTCGKCLNILEYYQGMVYLPRENIDYYDKVFSGFKYQGMLKIKMLQFKFRDNKYIAKTFGEIASLMIKKYNLTADLIIPVPISKKRLLERGYNQSEYIARYASKLSGIGIKNDILFKIKDNLRQSDLDKQNRLKNVDGVYCVKNNKQIIDKKVILIDDIFTTGATINECAKVLKNAGAREIIVITILYSCK